MSPITLPTGVKGPLPEGVVGIILGRSSLSMQGISVIPGVIDSDFTGEIKVMIAPSTKTVQFHKGQRVAQLVLLPYHPTGQTLTLEARGEQGFGSSDAVFYLHQLTRDRPMKTLSVGGKSIIGLIDTGADVSCIAGKDWPSSWPAHAVEGSALVGIGAAASVAKSSQILHWSDDENAGTFCPYIIPSLPFSLWGRDVLTQMGMLLYSPNNKVTEQMLQMGYNPKKGLGKQQQGRRDPIMPQEKLDRHGIGYEKNL